MAAVAHSAARTTSNSPTPPLADNEDGWGHDQKSMWLWASRLAVWGYFANLPHMMGEKMYRILGWLMLLLALVYGYFGLFDTIYSLGIYLVPLVLVLAAVAALLWYLLCKKRRKYTRLVFLVGGNLGFLYLIVAHLVSTYKPTVRVRVPKDFAGVVTLVIVKRDTKEVLVNERGIGYLQHKGNVRLKVLQAGVDITDALNDGGVGHLQFWDEDSMHYRSLDISCFEVQPGKRYASSSYNQRYLGCMKEEEFWSMLQRGEIDSSDLYYEYWPK